MAPIQLSPNELKELSALWDKALALQPDELTCWLQQLQVSSPAVLSALEYMISRRSGVEDSFLQNGISPLPIDLMSSLHGTQGVGADVGKYRLVRELGRGGMGVVWLAERADGLMRRNVALKIPHPWLSARFMDRFATEREILASLSHPHIARLYEADRTSSGQPYLVLEYIDGEPLVAYCATRTLSLKKRLELFLQVLDAVQFAHERQVVHRDLKPTNIIVSEDGQAHLLDFGIAKLYEDGDDGETTQFEGAVFTPNYASPEQIAGESVSFRSDIYTLGVLLYELLTGSLPYSLDRATRALMRDALFTTIPRRPSEMLLARSKAAAHDSPDLQKMAQQLRGDLDTIVMTAMHLDAQRRYVSAKAFADDIRRHLSDQPVLSRPDSVSYRASLFIKRYKFAVASTAVVILSLGGGMIAAIRSANEAHEQARIAQEQHTIADKQSRIASENERTAAAVVNFMESLFGSTSAIVSERKKAAMTVRELIDAGASRIDMSLNDAPRAKSRLLGLMGGMYQGLDLPDQAAQMFAKRIELERKAKSADPRPLVDALLQYATFLLSYPTEGSAAPVLKEASTLFEGVREVGLDDTNRRGLLELCLANMLYREKPEEAARHIERAVAAFRITKDPAGYPEALAGLAYSQLTAGHLAGAIKTSEEAMRVGLPNDPQHFSTMRVLCDAQRDTGDLSVAIQECRHAYDTGLSIYGAVDGDTPALARRLAKTLMIAGQCRAAQELLESEVSELRTRSSPATRRELAATYVMLAEANVRDGRPVEAEQWLRALAKLDITDGKSQNQTFFVLPDGVRAVAFALQGKLADASATVDSELAMLRQYMAHSKAVVPSPYAASLLETAVRVALARGDLSSAEEFLGQMRQAYVWPSDEPKHPLSNIDLNARVLSARVALAMKKYDDAATLAANARTLIDSQPDAVNYRLWSLPAELVLGQVDLKAGRTDSALRHFDRAVALARASGDGSLNLAEALAWQAQARLAVGSVEPAEISATAARHIIQEQKTTSAVYLEPLGVYDKSARLTKKTAAAAASSN